jgi:hypothetical protein
MIHGIQNRFFQNPIRRFKITSNNKGTGIASNHPKQNGNQGKNQ